MTYSTDEVQYILNLFCFFQKNNYNSVQIKKNERIEFIKHYIADKHEISWSILNIFKRN